MKYFLKKKKKKKDGLQKKNKEEPHTKYTGAPTKIPIGGRKGTKNKNKKQELPFKVFSGKR